MDQHLQSADKTRKATASGYGRHHIRYSIPLGTRSIVYLTRLLKPQLDEQKFNQSFRTWEFQLAKYEQDNHTLLPDAVKMAILLNETQGPLQQHLQSQAGYYRAASSSNRLPAITSGNSNNRGPAPMDIGATWRNKGKGNTGKRKGKGKYNNGKGKGRQDKKDMAKEKDTTTKRKAKGTRTTRIWQRRRIQQQRKRQGRLQQSTRRKRSKRKATNDCSRCGQPEHMAKQCRVAIYNCDTGNFDTNGQTDDWDSQAHYGSNWYHEDQTQMQQLALPQPADSSAVPISGFQEVTTAMIGAAQQFTEDNKWVSLMIDSSAATPVCPPWFATQFPLFHYSTSSTQQDHN